MSDKLIQKPILSKLQRRRDGQKGDPIKELVEYLKGNEKWIVTGAMVGFLDEDQNIVCVTKPKGSQSYITWKQNPQNHFFFPLIESFSLLLSGRLIVSSKDISGSITHLTAHRFYNHLIEKGYNHDQIIQYQAFTRIGSTRKKDPHIRTPKLPTIPDEHKGYLNKIMQHKNKMKITEGFRTENLFPQSFPVKFPSGHGFPADGYISIGLEPDGGREPSSIIIPLSVRYMALASDPPMLNAYVSFD